MNTHDPHTPNTVRMGAAQLEAAQTSGAGASRVGQAQRLDAEGEQQRLPDTADAQQQELQHIRLCVI